MNIEIGLPSARDVVGRWWKPRPTKPSTVVEKSFVAPSLLTGAIISTNTNESKLSNFVRLKSSQIYNVIISSKYILLTQLQNRYNMLTHKGGEFNG